MKVKRFEEGGTFTELGGSMDIIGGAIKGIYGVKQLRDANQEYDRAKAAAPSLETPAQFYENYRNAYDSEIARMELDSIQGNVATSVQALQGAGGRALVGGLGAAVATSQSAQNRMLVQERAARMQAGSQLAKAESQAIGRKETRNQNEQAQAAASASAARENISQGITSVATGAMAGGLAPIGAAASAAIGGVKKGANALGKLPGKFNQFMVDRQISKTQEALGEFGGGSENMNQFILNQNDYIKSVGASWDEYNKPKYGFYGKQERIPVQDEALDRAAMIQAQFVQDQTAQALPVQETTGRRVGSGGGITGGIASGMPSEKELQFRQDQIGRTPAQQNGFIDPVTGQWISNPNPVNDYGVKSIPGTYKDGGMMTKGSFNHGSNPIDIVQDGVKVGEATGNEYILNPDQAKKIIKESSYARKLFKQFEKKAKSKK